LEPANATETTQTSLITIPIWPLELIVFGEYSSQYVVLSDTASRKFSTRLKALLMILALDAGTQFA
jgi:hypothetical protein